jgi:tRNA A-37 threonylcarbamoyl transferase component Bud32
MFATTIARFFAPKVQVQKVQLLGRVSVEAEVYLTNRNTALKEFTESDGINEKRALQALAGLNIAPKLVSYRKKSIEMEFVAGQTLTSFWLDYTDRQARHKVLKALATAIAKLHDAGWYHGDLHSSNIMVTGLDEVKLIDFNRAKRCKDSEVLFGDVETFCTDLLLDDADRLYLCTEYAAAVHLLQSAADLTREAMFVCSF